MKALLREIDYFLKTKDNSIGEPEFYLGAKHRPMTLPDGVAACGVSASTYVQAAVAKSYHLREYPTQKWAKQTSGPFPCDYAPELDTTDLLNHEKIHILSVTDWCTALDSGARTNRYHHGGFGIVDIPRNASRGSPRSRIPCIQLFGETTQLADSFRHTLPDD